MQEIAARNIGGQGRVLGAESRDYDITGRREESDVIVVASGGFVSGAQAKEIS